MQRNAEKLRKIGKAEWHRIEDKRRFFFRAWESLGETLFHTNERRLNGAPVPSDPHGVEVIGDIPHHIVPGQITFEKGEIPQSPRFQAIRDSVEAYNERIKETVEDHEALVRLVVIGTVAGTAGAVVVGIGARYFFRHILDKKPEADITDIKPPH